MTPSRLDRDEYQHKISSTVSNYNKFDINQLYIHIKISDKLYGH